MTTLFRRCLPIIACLPLAGCIGSSLPKTPAHGGPAWQEITTDHFVVDTDLETADANAIRRQLENHRSGMTQLVFGGEPAKAPRMRVLALRQDEYAHFGHVASGNFVNWTLYQPILVTSPGGEWDTFTADVRKHE